MNFDELAQNRLKIVAQFESEEFRGTHTCLSAGPGGISKTLATMLGQRHGSGFKVYDHHVFVHRVKDSSRMSLFAQTPVWELSQIKSSREMLSSFGYLRGGYRKLNCTMRFREPNSQGLYLDFLEEPQSIVSRHEERGEILCLWPLDRILKALSRKHEQAVMVNVESFGNRGSEQFRFVSLTFYSNPKENLLQALLREGAISIDHLISEADNGSVVEKGPIFKLDRSKFLRMFSNVKTILLK